MRARRFRAALVTGVALCFFVGLPLSAGAAPGDLDTSFDGDGRVTTPIGTGVLGGAANALAVQADGRIVAAGPCHGSSYDFCLARYNTNGGLDTSFEGDGKVTTEVGASNDVANAVALQADGKIVAAGHCDIGGTFEFCLARYNTNGSPDNSFDDDGKLTTAIGSSNVAYGVAVQGDGKIVAAGTCTVDGAEVFCLARYTTSGGLDNSFDGDGRVTTDFGSGDDGANAVAVQADGKIVAAGACDSSVIPVFCLARYNAGGGLDDSFDGDGKVTTTIGTGGIEGTDDRASAVTVQADGKIVAAGGCDVDSTDVFCLARYTTGGGLDNSFDDDGKVTTAIGTDFDAATGVAVQGDGKIVAAGLCEVDLTIVFCLARYTAGGLPDNSFDGDGELTTAFGTVEDAATGVAVQADGRIVAAGSCHIDSTSVFCLARYAAHDLLIPNTIVSGPAGTWVRPFPTYTLSSDPDGAGFECRTNSSGSWAACVSPRMYAPVPGRQLFEFRATNAAGPDASPELRELRMVRPFTADWDGNGKADLSVWRPGSGGWYTQGAPTIFFGREGDVPVPGQWDADPALDRAVWRPASGGWYVEGNPTVYFGSPNDVPVAADWDGDGDMDPAVWRPVSGGWYVRNGTTSFFGRTGDIPVPGDYDADPQLDRAVYRPTSGGWFVEGSSTVFHGQSGDRPVPADWDGDGKTDIAVHSIVNNRWFVRNGTPSFFGALGDVAIAGDFDADPDVDKVVWRPGSGGWYVEGSAPVFFGSATDIP